MIVQILILSALVLKYFEYLLCISNVLYATDTSKINAECTLVTQ